MENLETGTLYIRSNQLEETHEHISRLSIRYNLTGEQRYRLGKNEHIVSPTKYLLVNQGQHYQTSFQGKSPQEMIMVAFKPGFAEEMVYSLTEKPNRLLDDPFNKSPEPIHFFEHTYDIDPVIEGIFQQLRYILHHTSSLNATSDLDTVYNDLFIRLYQLQNNAGKTMANLEAVKSSTRKELYRRLHIAKDFMDANFDAPISLNEVAISACMSVHHFKRTFKELFHVTPHQYLIHRRLEKAKAMLRQGHQPIADVCQATGFQDTSSFIRLFRKKSGKTPGEFRNSSN